MPIEQRGDKIVSQIKSSIPSADSNKCLHAEVAFNDLKNIENTLVDSFGACGIGLHEKISSVEHALPQGVVIKLRALATFSDEMPDLLDTAEYEAQCHDVLTELGVLSGNGTGWELVCILFVGMSGFVGFSIGVRNFGFGAGIVFSVAFMLYCIWIIQPKMLRNSFLGKAKKR